MPLVNLGKNGDDIIWPGDQLERQECVAINVFEKELIGIS